MENKHNQRRSQINNDEKSFNLDIQILINIFDLSICDENIKLVHNLSQFQEVDIKSAKNYAKKGIDVFNASDSFFNDLCNPYDDKDNKDIIIIDRRNDVYQNVTFCQIGCSYIGVDYDLVTANCLCNTNSIQDIFNNITNDDKMKQDESINFKTLSRIFKSNLFVFNFGVLYCYNLIFNFNILKRNIGFYFFIIMLIIQIILFIIHLNKKLNPIKTYMTSFKVLKKNDKKKDNTKKKVKIKIDIDKQQNESNKVKKSLKLLSLNDNLTSKSEKKKIKKNKFLNDTSSSKSNFNKNMNELYTSKSNNTTKNRKGKKKSFLNKFFILETKSNDSDIKNSEKASSNLDLKNKSKKRIMKYNNIEKEADNIYSIIISKKENDLNQMDYKDMIKNDKRTYLRIYWSFFVYSKINIGTFCTENNLHLFVIKLSEITLFLNAFFLYR